MFLLVMVFGNILLWLIEQFVEHKFEFLCLSYIINGFLLLTFYGLNHKYERRMKDIKKEESSVDLSIINFDYKFSAKEIYKVEKDGENDVVYKYSYVSETEWTKSKEKTLPEEIYNTQLSEVKRHFADMIKEGVFEEKFEYNKQDKMYCSKESVMYSGVMQNIKLKFENGKLVWMESEIATGSAMGSKTMLTITYGNTVTEALPANIAELIK